MAAAAAAALFQVLGVAVPPDPVIEFLSVRLLTSPQHSEGAPCFLHHVHYAVQQLRGKRGRGDNTYVSRHNFKTLVGGETYCFRTRKGAALIPEAFSLIFSKGWI